MSIGFWVSYGLLWALTVFLALLLLGVLNSVFGRIPASAEPAATGDDDAGDLPEPIGRQAPSIEATDLAGQSFSSGAWGGRRSALLWVSPDCVSCKLTLPELEALHDKVNGNLIVICRSARSRCAQMAEEYGISVPVLVDEGEVVSKQFGVDIAPTAVIISEDGKIASIGHPLSADDLERLIRRQNGASASGFAGLDVIGPR
jgi:peroxiredoxin